MTRLTIILLSCLSAALCGCANGAGTRGIQQRVIQDADPDEVLAAAATILRREFGRVRVDPVVRRIETAPREFTTDRESGTARDLYRGRSTMRHKAMFDVGRRKGVTVARLRIDVERRDTVRHTVAQPRAYRLSDNPGQETPIYADAATTEEQNTVWTRVRRNTRLERALLSELRERFTRLSADEDVEEAAAESVETAPEADARD